MQRSLILLVSAFVGLALVIGALALARHGQAEAAGVGPTIAVGAPSLAGGNVRIPVSTTTTSADPFTGINIHLRWDPALFGSPTFDTTGTAIPGFAFCTPSVDVDGAGIVIGCVGIPKPSLTAPGLMGTVVLTPKATGCSAMHLFTFGPPDGGDAFTGTYTINPDNTPQSNVLVDGAASTAGATCVPPGAATPTPTPTNTAAATPTATATSTPTATATPLPGAPDVVVSAGSSPPAADSGAMVSYAIFVRNVGDATAVGVTVDVALPVGAVPLKNAQCKTWVAGHFICSAPNLAPNDHAPGGPDEAALVLTVQVPIVLGDRAAVATVAVAAQNEPPANAGNNTATVPTAVRGCPDLDGDNQVTLLDVGAVAAAFGTLPGDPAFNPLADLDGDGHVTIIDLTFVLSHLGAHCRGLDTDHDGITNSDEVNLYHTDPTRADTDGDGLPDGVEVLTYGSNPLAPDTSGDFYTDGQKAALGTDPTNYCGIMASDVDMDQRVTALDIGLGALAFGTSAGQPKFNPRVDLDRDGAVTILDLMMIVQHYGTDVRQCP